MLKAVVFDLDGTLIELTLPLDAMRRDTKKFYYSKGVPNDTFDEADGISSSKIKARKYFFSQGYSEEQWQNLEIELDVVLNSHEGQAAQNVVLHDGILDIVQSIRDMGLITAILTNNGRHAVDIIMSEVELADYFDIIQTRNESPKPKPFPDGLHHIAKRLDVRNNELVYVGDSIIDGAAARSAGIEFWGITTGETTRDILANSGASVVFESPTEILPFVRQRLKNT